MIFNILKCHIYTDHYIFIGSLMIRVGDLSLNVYSSAGTVMNDSD